MLSKKDEYIEASEVTWALELLILALHARIEVALHNIPLDNKTDKNRKNRSAWPEVVLRTY